MIYRNDEGRNPSLLVREGHIVVIGAREARELGIPSVPMQARTTAGLLTLAGLPPAEAPRLSDRTAFEQVERTEGLVSFGEPDQDGRIAGYSVPFLRGVLESLDPAERVPPRTVKRAMPKRSDNHHCRCGQQEHQAMSAARTATSVAAALAPPAAAFGFREIGVPEFIAKLKVFGLFTRLGDIVVERNATLILGPDITFAIADNVLGYTGSRIVQRASNMNFDVTGTMRGSLLRLVHRVTDVLKVDFVALAAEPATKP